MSEEFKVKYEKKTDWEPIPNGQHTGKIIELKKGETSGKWGPYTEIILTILFDNLKDKEGIARSLTFKCPFNLGGTKSRLKQLLAPFIGKQPIVGEEYDLEEILKDKDISFTIVNTPPDKDDKSYSNIVDGTIMPNKVEEKKPEVKEEVVTY